MNEAELERAKTLLARLMAFPTISDQSNLPLIDFVESYLLAEGAPFVRLPNAAGDKAAILATIGPARDGGVVLSGHTDVVPTAGSGLDERSLRDARGGGPHFRPRLLRHEGLRRLRAGDDPALQGGRPQAPHSYRAELRRGDDLPRLARHHPPLRREIPGPSLVIVGEPSMMAVADAHKSVATFRTIVTGHEAHSANPTLGANAIAVAADIVSEIGRLAREYESHGERDPRFIRRGRRCMSGSSRAARRATFSRANAGFTGSSAACPA